MEEVLDLIKEKFGSQAEMARKLNWPRQKLNYFVLGQRIPQLTDISKMAELLNVSIEWLAEKFLSNKSIKS